MTVCNLALCTNNVVTGTILPCTLQLDAYDLLSKEQSTAVMADNQSRELLGTNARHGGSQSERTNAQRKRINTIR